MKPFFLFQSRLRSFLEKTDGVAAVEFALILPILLVLLIGMSETTEALNYDRKVSQVASTMADLVAQAQNLTPAELDDYYKGAERIMEPYDAGPLTIVIASVSFNAKGEPTVDWSHSKGIAKWPTGSEPPIKFPDVVKIPQTTIVVGKTSYEYKPMFASLLQNLFPRSQSMTLGDTYYLRPRLTDKIDCQPCE